MKFLFLIGSLEVGGAEKQLVLLAQGLAAAGHEVHFACFSGDGPLASLLRESGVVLHGLIGRESRFPTLVRLTMAQLRLVMLARRLRPDVVQAYLPLTCLMAGVAGRLGRAPCIVIGRRALASHQDRSRFGAIIDRLANRLAHAITANSQAVKQDHVARDGLSSERICVIPNAINVKIFLPDPVRRNDTRRSLGLDTNQTAILCVGNLIPYKGHTDLIAALSSIETRTLRLHLFLAGRPEALGERLIALAKELGVPLTLLGPRDDIPDLLQAADLFVLPSHEEGSSNALLEAIIACVPVVATDVGGNAALLLGGRGGRLCQPRNPAALASAISEALADPEDSKARALRAQAAAMRDREPSKIVACHMALYESISKTLEMGK
jgi:glycosyltransferase involved in cell wall biosynthesis